MVSPKVCEYCLEPPELQKGLEFDHILSPMDKYRYACPRCNIQGKSAYTIEGAVELWNGGTDEN